MTENEFLINHYAGSVKYDVRGFLDKNKDELVTNLKEVMQTSKDTFISDVLFHLPIVAVAGVEKVKKNRRDVNFASN